MDVEKITKEHILQAVDKIDREGVILKSSTKYDVIINGKAYPPKEVMRYANMVANGKKNWLFSGGEPTNIFLKRFGFNVIDKGYEVLNASVNINVPLSGKVWKLGCKWGKGAPSFYELIKARQEVICTTDKHYSIGDLVIVAEGHNALAITKVIEVPKPSTNIKELEDPFEELKIEYDDWVEVAKAEWYELKDNEKFEYPTTMGRHSAGDPYNSMAISIWNGLKIINNSLNYLIPGMNINLNTILYGPPGTGKTYNTINKALSIIDGAEKSKLNSRADEHARFNELLDNGTVQFISFHQSMSYEDFIEGIKPHTRSGTIQYSVRSGLFKSICYKALKSMYHANQPKNDELDLDVLYEEFVKHLQDTYKENDYRFKSKENSQLRLDKEELDKGKIVVYFRYSNSVKKEGEGKTPFPIKKEKIIKMYEINVTGEEQNLKAKLNPILTYHLYPYFAVYKSFLEFVRDKVGDNSEAYLKEESTSDDSDFERYLEQLQLLKKQGVELKKGQAHVLIIDEINRGNVSQIFGELITLIEDDKRFGREEALEVTLPYSQEKFVVPENLYIIGTMNTADRSVEALDTALRRRFSFEEKMPELQTLNTDVDGVNLQLLVGKINERLELLLDRDHTIGHAWFIGCKSITSLKEIFENKIIPLLKEFFYNDYGKIGLILGDAFFEEGRNSKENVFASFKRIDPDIKKELAQKPVFHFRIPDDHDQLIRAFQSIYPIVKPAVDAELN
jgi:5-methylcytosine-specific restriction endonuclease McrBC GTP-binding regulatory subunit McrB